MTRYLPITGIDCTIPSLLIDTEAPIDVLHDTAAYRIRSITQLLETLSLGEAFGGDAELLQECARVLVIPCAMVVICWMWSGGGCGRSFNSANKNGRLQGRPFLYPTFNIIRQIYTHSISQEVAKTSSANFLI